MSSERKKPANDDSLVPEKPPKLRKQNRRLEDKEIGENLINESDDNCSNFDDDIGDRGGKGWIPHPTGHEVLE
ncbi:unnamed protein product [Parnassius apollo]|uniref:(apollo) hypothetical protein n=1 Tax=Parnassius apollo TaxID=110799 RepID=A0A8S3WSN7_PARAO|nr:unnamed protein product [Parnassius apollo]